jgi:hypothetical protein
MFNGSNEMCKGYGNNPAKSEEVVLVVCSLNHPVSSWVDLVLLRLHKSSAESTCEPFAISPLFEWKTSERKSSLKYVEILSNWVTTTYEIINHVEIVNIYN